MKKNLLWAAAAALIMTATLPSCGDDNSVEPNPDIPLDNTNNELKPIRLTAEQRQLVNQSNDFAFNLFRRTTLGGPAGPCDATPQSTILSPISITYALGMLNNGAAGETQQQINQVLGFGETGADGINEFCKKMLTEAPQLDKLTKVMIANTLYVNKDYHLLPSFVQKANDYYGAQPETRDFADGKTLDVINQWASELNTHMARPAEFQVLLYHLTPEFYRFVKSINDIDNNELAQSGFSLLSPTFTNITGGIGILGAYAVAESTPMTLNTKQR